MTESLIKLVMTRELETIDQINSSVRSMTVIDTGRSNKEEPFPRPLQTSKAGGPEAIGYC